MINFNEFHNIENPTLVLAKKNGDKIGVIETTSVSLKIALMNPFELQFSTYKYKNNHPINLWDEITNFKLVWCKEIDTWFEINVEINETEPEYLIKNVSGKRLAEAELSQLMLYDIHINDDVDISNDNYKAAVIFDETDSDKSLLNRILKDKAPHYKIKYVSSTIKNIQRTFTFSDISIYDAFQQIAEEIDCLFIFSSNSNEDGGIDRSVSVYDLLDYCVDCGERNNFTSTCTQCNNDNILWGYGEDTTIFVASDSLANDIMFSTDVDSVKNCFKLEAGDDLMTSTIISSNPNGTPYLWYISDELKKDMSTELSDKINSYDILMNHYQNIYNIPITNIDLQSYNLLADKYKLLNPDIEKIEIPIIGYKNLSNAIYNTIDFSVYLQSALMPSVQISNTNALEQSKKIKSYNSSKISVQDLSSLSLSTSNSVVLSMVKIIVDSRYKVKINSSDLQGSKWIGDFIITNFSDDNDTVISDIITFNIDDDYENYLYQKIEKVINKDSNVVNLSPTSIDELFKLEYNDFCNELKKYSLSCLQSFYDACQSCLDILIEQGVADEKSWFSEEINLYQRLYLPYYEKLLAIQEEVKVREYEVSIINTLQDNLNTEKEKIQIALNFENYLGQSLWLEFCSFRRESKFSNSNYISDGLNNAEIFNKALEFIENAKKEIYKSAELQHTISTSLKNLFAIKEFNPLKQHFKVGNWIRILSDEKIYKLRLLEYEINFDSLDNITVLFSDVRRVNDGFYDKQKLFNQVQSMTTTYDSVSKQASQGKKGNEQLENWVDKGLALTNMKIIGNADNQNISWDSHGISMREYLPITDTYSEKQIKIINKGVYVTDDDWRTSKAGIGNFLYFDPKEKIVKEGYGVIADQIVSNIILSENVGIYNAENNITMDNKGLTITTNGKPDNDQSNPLFTIQREYLTEDGKENIEPIMYIDSNGKLVLSGSVYISTPYEGINDLNDLCDDSRFISIIENKIDPKINMINNTIELKYQQVFDDAMRQLNQYKADVGQYINFNEDGLTLGAVSSNFKTVIDNKSLRFVENDTTVAYINNKQLNIFDAIIRNSLVLGNFFFSPREDGGVSLTWQH